MNPTSPWTSIRQLRELSEFYEGQTRVPNLTTDEALLAAVRRSFWGTNAVDFVDAAFAIIAARLSAATSPHEADAPGASSERRSPQAWRMPTRSWPGGGRCADARQRVSVRPKPDGFAWLTQELPTLREVVRETVAETLVWVEAGFPGDDLW